MGFSNNKKITYKLITKPSEILKYLSIGISIPIIQEFHKYILYDLQYFKAKSFLLMEDENPVGHSLIFDDEKNHLYFGYFRVNDHNEHKIELLIDKILKYAKEHKYAIIRGPINIPAIIFGWGFMEEGSLDTLFIGKPANPPIYQEIFLMKGFSIKYRERTWEGPIPRFNPWRLKKYDYNDYEFITPKDWKDLMNLKSDFIRLHSENLPPSARITPNVDDLFDNYADFVVKFGENYMFNFIKHKPSNKIVACGCYFRNPFQKDTIIAYSWVVDPKYRRKGLVLLMVGATSLPAWKDKFRYCSGTIASDNFNNSEVAKRLGLDIKRTHLILEYNCID
jgi:hypothetical protein